VNKATFTFWVDETLKSEFTAATKFRDRAPVPCSCVTSCGS